jgi:hypothetical protein
MHPVRIKVRRLVAENLRNEPKKLQAWRRYYQTHQFAPFYYKSFVLSLSTDYPFVRIVPNDQLGYPSAAVTLKDFPDILNEFWTTAHIDQIWQEVKVDYLEDIHRYSLDKMNHQMTFLWDYLCMERQDVFTIVQVPDLLDHHLGASGAGYESYYYSVDNPGSHEYALNVHEYLHTIVNPLVQGHYANYKAKLETYYRVAKETPAVQQYREPVTFVFECLVRALDRRISVRFEDNDRVKRICEWQVSRDTKEGLNLTQPFYDLMTEYEQSNMSFEEYLPSILKKLPEYTNVEGHKIAG